MEFIDIAFIVGYFIIVLAIGYFSSRKETSEGYLIADRKLTTFRTTTSMIASKIGGGLVLVAVAYIYTFGLSAFTYFVGSVLGYIIFYIFAKKLKKEADKNKFYTITDYLEHKFNKNTRWFSITLLTANIFSFATQTVGGGKIIEKVTGISFELSVFLMICLALIYMIMGGFKAVVFTDVFQCGVLLILFLAIVPVFTSQTIDFASIPFQQMDPLLLISFFLIGLTIPFSSMALWQRIYAAKDLKVVKRSLIASITIYTIFGVVLTFLGIAIKYLLPTIDADIALLEGFVHYLPAGMLGLGIIALMAVIMSSADTLMFNCSSIFLQDILRVKKNVKKYYRITFIALGLLGISIAIIFKNMVNLTLFYAVIIIMLGFLIILTWIFKLKKEYMKNTYLFLLLLTLLAFLIFGIDFRLGLIGFIIVPLSYGLSALVHKLRK